MTMRQRRALRTIATGSALGLAVGTVAVLGVTSPAAAADLDYTCTTPIGDRTFQVRINTNAPRTLPTGSTTNPRITAVQTVPAELADLMRGILEVTDASGTVDSTMTVNGAPRQRSLAIPTSSVGDSGDAQLTATGRLGTIRGGAPGSRITIGAGDQDVTMNLLKGDGSPAGTFAIPCSAAPGQTTTVDTVRVVKAASRTNATATYKKRKKKAVAKAKVRAVNGIAVNGKVRFVLKRGKKTIATKQDRLNRRDIAKAVFKRGKLRRPGKYKVIARYQGSDRLKKSADLSKFRVRR